MLLVDDEEDLLFAMKDFFSFHELEVDCARELEEAKALLSNIYYSVVVADLRLTGVHGKEGLELVGFIHQRCPRTRVIILTAYGSPEIEQEARRRGVDSFLHKPMTLPDILNVIHNFQEPSP